MRERRRVLLIEHDPDDRALVAAYLDQTGYLLQTAESEAQGLSLAPGRAGESATRVPQGMCPGGPRSGRGKGKSE